MLPEIMAQVMNTLISRLVVPGEAEINNANSHGKPYSVKLSHFCV